MTWVRRAKDLVARAVDGHGWSLATRWTALVLLSLAVGVGLWAGALVHWNATGFGDWQYFHHQWEAAYTAVARYGEWPLWDPWHCGGVFLFGDPQAQIYSPFFLLALATGTLAALKIMLLVHTAAGFAGAYVAARRLVGVGRLGGALAGVVFTMSGFFAWHLSGGHAAFMPFYFLPWVLLAWRKACDDWRYAAAVAAILALTIFEGGIYPLAYFTLFIAVLAVGQLLANWRRWRGVLVAGAISAALTALLGAFRLLPIMHTLARYPRPTAEKDVLSVAEIGAMLTSAQPDYKLPGHEYVWAEYGSYIGWSAFVLAFIGLVSAGQRGAARRHGWLIAGTLFFLCMTLGHFASVSPWAIVHELPVFGSLRVPSRFIVIVIFFLALAAALALDHFRDRMQTFAHAPGSKARTLAAALPVLVLVGVTVHIASGNDGILDRWSGPPLPHFEAEPATPYQMSTEGYGDNAGFPARGISHRGCYTGMAYDSAPGLWNGPVAQARTAAGTVQGVARTANTITVDVVLRKPGIVTVNQTWAADWTSDTGTIDKSAQGLIEVRDVPAGAHTLRLAYEPSDFAPAAALSLLGLAATLGVGVVWPRVQRRRRARRDAESVPPPGPPSA